MCLCPVFTVRVAPKPPLMKSKQGREEGRGGVVGQGRGRRGGAGEMWRRTCTKECGCSAAGTCFSRGRRANTDRGAKIETRCKKMQIERGREEEGRGAQSRGSRRQVEEFDYNKQQITTRAGFFSSSSICSERTEGRMDGGREEIGRTWRGSRRNRSAETCDSLARW